jgi:hypothetical protein
MLLRQGTTACALLEWDLVWMLQRRGGAAMHERGVGHRVRGEDLVRMDGGCTD